MPQRSGASSYGLLRSRDAYLARSVRLFNRLAVGGHAVTHLTAGRSEGAGRPALHRCSRYAVPCAITCICTGESIVGDLARYPRRLRLHRARRRAVATPGCARIGPAVDGRADARPAATALVTISTCVSIIARCRLLRRNRAGGGPVACACVALVLDARDHAPRALFLGVAGIAVRAWVAVIAGEEGHTLEGVCEGGDGRVPKPGGLAQRLHGRATARAPDRKWCEVERGAAGGIRPVGRIANRRVRSEAGKRDELRRDVRSGGRVGNRRVGDQ